MNLKVKMNARARVLLVLFFLAQFQACGVFSKKSESDPPAALAPVGAEVNSLEDESFPLRSLREMQDIFEIRVFQGTGTYLGKYLGERVLPTGTSIVDLLGTTNGFGVTRRSVNRTPNGLNISLWQLIVSSFVKEVSENCDKTGEAQRLVSKLALEKFVGFCSRTKSKVADAAYSELWFQIMAFDAPPDEFEEWKKFVQSLPENGNRLIGPAVASMLMNPYLIIGR